MPPLKDVLTKGLPKGYVPMEEPNPPAVQSNDQAQQASSVMRCPIPATNADADSIRMAQKGHSSPQFRILPLPPQAGGSTVIKTGGGTSAASGSIGGTSGGPSAALVAAAAAAAAALISSTTTAPKASAVSLNVNIPAQGAILTRVTASMSFQIFSVAATTACCVRLYGSPTAQSFDSSRPVDAPVPAELTQGIILDVVFDTAPFTWNTQNIVGIDANVPQTTSLYVSVFNPTLTPLSNVTVTISYVPIES